MYIAERDIFRCKSFHWCWNQYFTAGTFALAATISQCSNVEFVSNWFDLTLLVGKTTLLPCLPCKVPRTNEKKQKKLEKTHAKIPYQLLQCQMAGAWLNFGRLLRSTFHFNFKHITKNTLYTIFGMKHNFGQSLGRFPNCVWLLSHALIIYFDCYVWIISFHCTPIILICVYQRARPPPMLLYTICMMMSDE